MIRPLIFAAVVAAMPLPVAAEVSEQPLDAMCGSIDEIGGPIEAAGERPLLTADSERGSRLVLWVNQNTGTYTVALIRPDFVACVIDAGTGFEPYLDPYLAPEVEQ